MSQPTLWELVEAACRAWPERVALQLDRETMTYATLGSAASAVAGNYRRLGVEPGDRVVCQVSNRAEHLVAAAGAWAARAIHVSADHDLTGHELAGLVGRTGARVLVLEARSRATDPLEAARAVAKRHPRTQVVLVGEPQDRGWLQFSELTGVASSAVPPARPEPASVPMPGPKPEEPAFILPTSGTTGVPKLPLGCHGPFAQGWARTASRLGFGPEDVHLAHLRLSHGFGLSTATMALATGGRLVLLPRFSPEEVLRVVASERVSVLNGTPAHFLLLAERFDQTRHDLSSLRAGVGTASTFPTRIRRWIVEELGMEFMVMYGSSEGVSVVTTDRDDILAGSVGSPRPGGVIVVGPDRKALPAGRVGEIAFSRARWKVAYWGQAEDPPSQGGWYYTGDLGRLDPDGRLYVLGRIKHQIDRGGLKVDPGEVEAALLSCPEVADAAVVGLRHSVLGETVCACVVSTPGEAPTLQGLTERLSSVLAPYKLPEGLCLLKAIPRTDMGKVDRDRLTSLVGVQAEVEMRASANGR